MADAFLIFDMQPWRGLNPYGTPFRTGTFRDPDAGYFWDDEEIEDDDQYEVEEDD